MLSSPKKYAQFTWAAIVMQFPLFFAKGLGRDGMMQGCEDQPASSEVLVPLEPKRSN